jgi:hypothetical protein
VKERFLQTENYLTMKHGKNKLNSVFSWEDREEWAEGKKHHRARGKKGNFTNQPQ